MARIYAKPDLFASLTRQQLAALDEYTGPEVLGGPGPLVRQVERSA